jgi:hypothetical protein
MVRAWHLFFGPAAAPWSHILRGAFGHVAAAGYDAEHKLWIFFNPSARSLMIRALPEGPECAAIYGEWVAACRPHILRIVPQQARRLFPPCFSCVGAIKALCGIRSRALLPGALYRDLVAQGAEQLKVPDVDVQETIDAAHANSG